VSNRRRRAIGITTKVTAEEYAKLKPLAKDRTVSEWARETLLAAAAPRLVDTVMVGDLIAIRTLLLNLSVCISHGERLTDATMQRLITEADRDRDRRAHERLTRAATAITPAPRSEGTS
jgi:hypothetical protein